MKNTYFKTSFASSRLDLVATAKPYNDIAMLKPYALYYFGGDESSLVSINGNKSLQVMSPETTSYTKDSVIISPHTGKHLASDMTDSGSVTVITRLKTTTTSLKIFFGNLKDSADPNSSGWGVFTTSAKLYLTLWSASGTRPISSLDIGATIDINNYFTVAVSINKSNGSVVFYAEVNGIEYTKTEDIGGGYVGDGDNVAVGSSSYGVVTPSGEIEYDYFAMYDKVLDVNEIKSVISEIG